MMLDSHLLEQQIINVQEGKLLQYVRKTFEGSNERTVSAKHDRPYENSNRIVTTQPAGHELSVCDWLPSVIRIIPHCPPGFEILRRMDSLHLKELVRLSDENHYHAFDQNDRKKRIFTIKGKDNWFDGESLSLYDSEKTEILTASTHTKDMLQRVTIFCPPGRKVLYMEKDVHFCRNIKYIIKSLNGEEIYNIASYQPALLIPYVQSRKYNSSGHEVFSFTQPEQYHTNFYSIFQVEVSGTRTIAGSPLTLPLFALLFICSTSVIPVIDCEEEEVARIIVSSNICVTGDMIDLKFFVELDVRLKAALLAATVIIHLASGVTTTKQAGV